MKPVPSPMTAWQAGHTSASRQSPSISRTSRRDITGQCNAISPAGLKRSSAEVDRTSEDEFDLRADADARPTARGGTRPAQGSEEAARASAVRRRRLIQLGGVLGAAIVIVAVLVAVSSSGGGPKKGIANGPQANRTVAAASSLLNGIPQSGKTPAALPLR